MDYLHRYHKIRRITLVGAAINTLLGVIKIIGGIYGKSSAIIADGVHSLSDLLTDALVLFASRFGSRGADHDHPYGHRRIETAATMGLAQLLIIVGLGIVAQGGHKLWHGVAVVKPNPFVLAIALLSIVANEGLFHYTMKGATQLSSKLLSANAWHHRSDAAASFIVLLGVAGSIMGYGYFDAIAAIVIGLMIVKMGWQLGWSSILELVDTGVATSQLAAIKAEIQAVPGVEAIHQLRTRSMGGHIFVDVHLLVKPFISVSEGHQISQHVQKRLQQNILGIHDVTVHVDPEDDEDEENNLAVLNLPLRPQVQALLFTQWQDLPQFSSISQVDLHYVNGKIHINVYLPLSELESDELRKLHERYRKAISDIPEFGKIQLFFFYGKE